jgi:hypothetical protein
MSDETAVEGTVTDAPDDDPANVVSGPAGSSVARLSHEWLLQGGEGGELAEDDPYKRIIQQILSAESPDIVLTPVEPVQASQVVGHHLELFGHSLNKSEYDVGSPFYASMEVKNHTTAESQVVNCGHKAVIAQLIKLEQFGDYPYHVTFAEKGRSAQGTAMLRLVKWTEPELSEPPF